MTHKSQHRVANSIPTVWRIDVEPDDFSPGAGLPPWTGFRAAIDLVNRLRGPLEDASSRSVHPSWFFRLDPAIEHAYGRADFVAHQYRDLLDGLLLRMDTFGIHVHYYRWDASRRVSYSDHGNPAWIAHCMQVAADAFEQNFGEPPRRTSQGAYYLSDAVIDAALTVGIQVDVTPEPGFPSQDQGETFGAYTTAPSPDYRRYPRRPYYPSRGDLAVAATSSSDARPILMVPLTSYDYSRALAPWPKRLAKTVLQRNRHLPLSPWKMWTNPQTYWDLVERAVTEGPAAYLALAIRTDAPGSQNYLQMQALFEYLPHHPIARRLHFVDPLSSEIQALASGSSLR